MCAAQISKQDYLRKYLSAPLEKKKRRRKKVTNNSIIKSKIIDDDIDLDDIKPIGSDEMEVYDVAEEAPQIVGIIDERPEEVRLMCEYKNTKKWRIVTDESGSQDVKVTAISYSDESNELKEIKEENNESTCQQPDSTLAESKQEPESNGKVKNSDSDPKTQQEDVHHSPLRKIKKEKSDSDISPQRKSGKQYDLDPSPPRKSKKNYEPCQRKIKKEKSDSDASPPRRSRKHSLVLKKGKKEKSDSDSSPERKSKRQSDSDQSPPRKSTANYDSDQSPPRRRKKSNAIDSNKRKHDHSDPAFNKFSRKQRVGDSTWIKKDVRKKRSKSPDDRLNQKESGKSKSSENTSKSKLRDEGRPKDGTKSKSTLSGRKSGLQNAEELRREIEEMKEREKEMKMYLSGKDEAVVVRDKKTGMRIDPKEQARKRREKEGKEADKLARYAVWGKGVKQVQDSQNKLKDDLYEMSKPLARYADDKDLDNMLRNKEWDGDPMLDYIRKKKKKKEPQGKDSQKPEYEGSYLPNRYGIKPGYRWDGVDRSNGYEKKWFEEQNARKAREEEAFKWSTSDM